MEENKNTEEVKNEQTNNDVKADVAENKPEEKKYNEKNLTFSIILAAIVLGLGVLHSILGIISGACGGWGNFPWFILNVLFAAAGVCVTIVAGLFFFKVTKDNLKKDIPSFVVSLAAFIVCALFTLWRGIDTIVNLVGFINELVH